MCVRSEGKYKSFTIHSMISPTHIQIEWPIVVAFFSSAYRFDLCELDGDKCARHREPTPLFDRRHMKIPWTSFIVVAVVVVCCVYLISSHWFTTISRHYMLPSPPLSMFHPLWRACVCVCCSMPSYMPDSSPCGDVFVNRIIWIFIFDTFGLHSVGLCVVFALHVHIWIYNYVMCCSCLCAHVSACVCVVDLSKLNTMNGWRQTHYSASNVSRGWIAHHTYIQISFMFTVNDNGRAETECALNVVVSGYNRKQKIRNCTNVANEWAIVGVQS